MNETNANLDKLLEYLDQPDINQLKQIRDIEPIEPWVNSTYYLGDEAKTIFPYWKEEVIIPFFKEGKNELILTGGLGTGKSNTADIIMARKIYEASCFNHPALQYGLASSTVMAMVYLSVTIDQALDQGFGHLKNIVDTAPYFQENFPRNTRKNTKLLFPNDSIKVHAGSNERHFIGLNLFGVVFDEANFVNAGGGDEGKMKKAMNIYRESANRKKSRFFVDGKEHGVRILISSNNLENSFVETRVEELKDDPDTMIINAKVFDVKPHEFSRQRFWVFKGSNYIQPFVIDNDNLEKYNEICKTRNLDTLPFIEPYVFNPPKEIEPDTVSIPKDFYQNFKLDPFGSLKEVAGVSIKKQGKLIYDEGKYNACINPTMTHPFLLEEFVVSTGDKVNQLILNLRPDFFGDRKTKHYFGIDLSLSRCSCGLSMGYVDPNTGKVTINLMLKVKPPTQPEQINISDIEEFIMYLKDKRGFNITDIVTDTFQTASTHQLFKRLGYNSYDFSIEKDEPYLFMTNKVIAGEAQFYRYPIFKKEFFGLVHKRDKGKVEHSDGTTKDVSDSVCRIFNKLYDTERIKSINRTDPIGALAKLIKKTKKFQDLELARETRDRVIEEEMKRIGQPLAKTGQ